MNNTTAPMAALEENYTTDFTTDFLTNVTTSWMSSTTNNISSNGTNETNVNGYTPPFSPPVTAVLAFLIGVVILITVCGNLLVIIAFWQNRNLRTTSNYFLLNLAFADFLIGSVAIPMYVPYILSGVWSFGHEACIVWLVIDYCVCSASTLNIMAISLDRYHCVTQAVKYSMRKSIKRTMCHMGLVWIIAFLLYGPAIIGWEHFMGERVVPNDKCYVEFHANFPFTFTASLVEFFTPFISVSFFYCRIYMEIRKRTQAKMARRVDLHNIGPKKTTNGNARLKKNRLSPTNNVKESEKEDQKGTYDQLAVIPIEADGSSTQSAAPQGVGPSTSSEPIIVNSDQRKKKPQLDMAKEMRVAKTLAIIVLVFGICWAPYTILTLVRTVCQNCISDVVYEVSFWFLWLNSTVNPIVYAACHTQFRAAFIALLGRWYQCIVSAFPAAHVQESTNLEHRNSPEATTMGVSAALAMESMNNRVVKV
uniref:Predicted novel histamine H3-like G-protein coupled receptor n=1 Tax=Branchiostoma floridae TaxID=7739 RepID=A0PFN1_BRAFL|nr:predicted novel histamine H3-like G-protein coupled receptor [Branchiostoma floridae]